jgi:DNA-3-methyladenine glycosylase II
VVVRGAGAPDVFPATEGRLHRAMAALYGLVDATPARLAAVAEAWTPYRSWVSVLIRTATDPTEGARGGRFPRATAAG